VELYKNRQWHNPPVSQVNKHLLVFFKQLPFLKRSLQEDYAIGDFYKAPPCLVADNRLIYYKLPVLL